VVTSWIRGFGSALTPSLLRVSRPADELPEVAELNGTW
jgi:hypothetical protein